MLRNRLLVGLAALLVAALLPGSAVAAEGPRSVGGGVEFAGADEIAVRGAEPEPIQRGSAGAPAPRIVGGQATAIDAFPWQAALTISPSLAGGSAQVRQICGGTLVAPTIVITAAHCVYDADVNGFATPASFSVVAGRTTLSSSQGVELPVSNYYVGVNAAGAPLYEHNASRWDVAVLQVIGPLPGSPIQVAGPGERATWAAGQPAFISGWGSTVGGSGPFPDQLRGAQVSIIDDSTCRSPNSYGSSFQSDVMVCAGTSSGGVDTCAGDSGGPLVVAATDGSVRLVGDTSFGAAQCGAARYPGVYGRLADDPIRSFLRNTVLELVGRDIVGEGGEPPVPPPASLTAEQALDAAWAYSKRECNRWSACRRYWAGECAARNGSYRCVVENLARNSRFGKFTCERAMLFSGSATAIARQALTRWKCRRGW